MDIRKKHEMLLCYMIVTEDGKIHHGSIQAHTEG